MSRPYRADDLIDVEPRTLSWADRNRPFRTEIETAPTDRVSSGYAVRVGTTRTTPFFKCIGLCGVADFVAVVVFVEKPADFFTQTGQVAAFEGRECFFGC